MIQKVSEIVIFRVMILNEKSDLLGLIKFQHLFFKSIHRPEVTNDKQYKNRFFYEISTIINSSYN